MKSSQDAVPLSAIGDFLMPDRIAGFSDVIRISHQEAATDSNPATIEVEDLPLAYPPRGSLNVRVPRVSDIA